MTDKYTTEKKPAAPTKEEVRDVMDDVEALDLPDGAHWAMIHERLGLDSGDVNGFIAADPEFYGYAKP